MPMKLFNTNKKYTDEDMLLWLLHPSKSDTVEYYQVSKFSQEFNDAMKDAMCKRLNDPSDEALVFIAALRSTPGYPAMDIETFLKNNVLRVLMCQVLENMYNSSEELQNMVVMTRYLVRVIVRLSEESNYSVEYFIYCRNSDEFHAMKEKTSSKEFQDALADGVEKCTQEYENNKYVLYNSTSSNEQSYTTYRLNYVDEAICKLTTLPFSRRLKIADYEKLLKTYENCANKQVYINVKSGEYDFRLNLTGDALESNAMIPRKSNIYSDSRTCTDCECDDVVKKED